MPGGNGTGPVGNGPMTGRAMGFCAGFGVPGYANPVGGRGMGMGRGRGMRPGRGRFGPGYAVPAWAGAAGLNPVPQKLTSDQELEVLKGQTKLLEDSLKQAKDRIEELQSGK